MIPSLSYSKREPDDDPLDTDDSIPNPEDVPDLEDWDEEDEE